MLGSTLFSFFSIPLGLLGATVVGVVAIPELIAAGCADFVATINEYINEYVSSSDPANTTEKMVSPTAGYGKVTALLTKANRQPRCKTSVESNDRYNSVDGFEKAPSRIISNTFKSIVTFFGFASDIEHNSPSPADNLNSVRSSPRR